MIYRNKNNPFEKVMLTLILEKKNAKKRQQ